MAIHNYVSLFGVVRTAPQIKTGMYGRTAMVAVTVVRGDRKEDTMLLRTSLKYSSPILFTQDEDLIDGISEWKENDVIYSIYGEDIDSVETLMRLTNKYKWKKTLLLECFRNQQKLKISLVLD